MVLLKNDYRWLNESQRRKSIITIFNKPMIKKEIDEKIRQELGLSKRNNIDIKQFIAMGVVECIKTETGVGDIYKLTEKGKSLARRLSKERGIEYTYNEPEGIDWKIYGWIICANRRKKILFELKDKEKREK